MTGASASDALVQQSWATYFAARRFINRSSIRYENAQSDSLALYSFGLGASTARNYSYREAVSGTEFEASDCHLSRECCRQSMVSWPC